MKKKEQQRGDKIAVDQPAPLVLLWFRSHLAVRFVWKIPSS